MTTILLRFDKIGISVLKCEQDVLTKIPYFKTLLSSGMSETHTRTIDLFEEDVEVVRKYLFQTGEWIEFRDLCDLLLLADKWLDETKFERLFNLWYTKLTTEPDINLRIAFEMCVSLQNAVSNTVGSPLKTILTCVCLSLSKNYQLCWCETEDEFDFVLQMNIGHIPKLYLLAKMCKMNESKDISRTKLKMWLRRIDLKSIIGNTGSHTLDIPKILGMISKTKNPNLSALILKHMSSVYSIVEKQYDFDVVVDSESFESSKLSFMNFEKIEFYPDQDCHSKVSYFQIKTTYNGCSSCAFKIRNIPMKFTKQDLTTGSARFILNLDVPEHKTLASQLTNMYDLSIQNIKDQTKIIRQHIKYFDFQVDWYKNPVRNPTDRETGKILQSSILSVYSKVKTESRRGLTTRLLDYKTGMSYTLDELNQQRFTCVEGVITVYIYICSQNKPIFIVNLRKAYIQLADIPKMDSSEQKIDSGHISKIPDLPSSMPTLPPSTQFQLFKRDE